MWFNRKFDKKKYGVESTEKMGKNPISIDWWVCNEINWSKENVSYIMRRESVHQGESRVEKRLKKLESF